MPPGMAYAIFVRADGRIRIRVQSMKYFRLLCVNLCLLVMAVPLMASADSVMAVHRQLFGDLKQQIARDFDNARAWIAVHGSSATGH